MTEIKGILGSRFGENTLWTPLSSPQRQHCREVTLVTKRANVQHEEKLKKQTNKQAICFMRKT